MSLQVIQRNLGPCLVCGHAAIGINFGVATCAPCKAFFRRNAVKLGKIEFVCQENGDCPVTRQSRRICNCCRLAKCFRVGMQKSLILSDAEREARQDIVRQSREKRVLSTKKIQPMAVSQLTQDRLKYLLASDHALLTNVFGAYKQTHTLPDNSEYPIFPSVEHSLMHTFHNEYEERYKLFIDYCKLIPEFERLPIDDKKHILQNHFVETVIISNQTLSRYVSKALILSLQNVYGPVLFDEVKQIADRLSAYTYDPLILKLVLIIQILTNSISRYHGRTNMMHIYTDPLTVFTGQNIYVGLLWRYLLSRSPSDQDAVKFFNKLILDLLFLQRTNFLIERYVCNLENEVDQMTPLMQSLWLM